MNVYTADLINHPSLPNPSSGPRRRERTAGSGTQREGPGQVEKPWEHRRRACPLRQKRIDLQRNLGVSPSGQNSELLPMLGQMDLQMWLSSSPTYLSHTLMPSKRFTTSFNKNDHINHSISLPTSTAAAPIVKVELKAAVAKIGPRSRRISERFSKSRSPKDLQLRPATAAVVALGSSLRVWHLRRKTKRIEKS